MKSNNRTPRNSLPALVKREPPAAAHEARLVLTRHNEAWGEIEVSLLIAPFARDMQSNLDNATNTDLQALVELGRAAQCLLKQRVKQGA